MLVVCGACSSEPTFFLTVNLRTDYQPIREFISVKIEVDGQIEEKRADLDGQYVQDGEELATFEKLARSKMRQVDVDLVRFDDALPLRSTVLIEQDSDLILTIAITRDCNGVKCGDVDGIAQRCLQGVCVDARCRTGKEPFCSDLPLICTDNTQCTTSSPCATPVCNDGVCFEDGQNSSCASDEVCHLTTGCVPRSDEFNCATESDCKRDDESKGCINALCVPNVDLCIYDFASNGDPCGDKGRCGAGICVETCFSGITDGSETDIDCGGPACDGCLLGGTCLVNNDCLSDVCDTTGSGTCEEKDKCGNGVQETPEGCDDGDIIPGDGCDATCLVEDGGMCMINADCVSKHCSSGVCAAPTCDDNIQNGPETGVDCGGGCPGCPNGSDCAVHADCLGSICGPGNTCGYDCSLQTQIPMIECEALRAFFVSTNGQNWGTKGWFSDYLPCGWTGPKCTSGRVTELNFVENNMSGPFPTEFFNLTALHTIELGPTSSIRRLGINGSIPPEIGQLTELTWLRLYRANIGGTLPPEIGNLTKLKRFELRFARMNGPLPPEFGNMTALNYVAINDSGFTGPLPSTIGNLKSPLTFIIFYNKIGGTVPTSITSSGINYLRICPQDGKLTSDAATGTWMRNLATTDWSATDKC